VRYAGRVGTVPFASMSSGVINRPEQKGSSPLHVGDGLSVGGRLLFASAAAAASALGESFEDGAPG